MIPDDRLFGEKLKVNKYISPNIQIEKNLRNKIQELSCKREEIKLRAKARKIDIQEEIANLEQEIITLQKILYDRSYSSADTKGN